MGLDPHGQRIIGRCCNDEVEGGGRAGYGSRAEDRARPERGRVERSPASRGDLARSHVEGNAEEQQGHEDACERHLPSAVGHRRFNLVLRGMPMPIATIHANTSSAVHT
jgi:hypothetical protein